MQQLHQLCMLWKTILIFKKISNATAPKKFLSPQLENSKTVLYLDIILLTSLPLPFSPFAPFPFPVPYPKSSLDLDKVSLISHSLSLLLLRLFFKLDWATFSKIASRDLDKYRLRSVILSRHVWQDRRDELGPP